MRGAIFLNGAPDEPGLLRRLAEGADLVLAADGGTCHALNAGIVPDLIVGDMDSLGEAGVVEAENLDFLCASGGKFSALFAVPHLLLSAERMGIRAAAVGGWGRAFVVEAGSRTVAAASGKSVSVFPFTGPATGVTLTGFGYPLNDARLEIGDTLGFHNELITDEGRASVREGTLLVIQEPPDVAPEQSR